MPDIPPEAPSQTPPRAVVFDIGNVLIEWDPARAYDRRIGPARRERLFAEVDLNAMNLSVDGGAPFRASVAALAEAHPDWSEEVWQWHDHWLEMVTPAIKGSVRLKSALRRAGVPVHALTNFGIETFALAQVHYPFLTEFDEVFVSGHLRLLKPDPGIYAAVEKGTGLSGGALFFTDDNAANVAAAEARGWRAHLFDGAEGLAARLVSEGLLQEGAA